MKFTTRTLLLAAIVSFAMTSISRAASAAGPEAGSAAPRTLPPSTRWESRFAQILPLMGHRNWIMVVDSAYPLQTSPGVEVLETNSDEMTVLRKVLAGIAGSIHVRPLVYLDAELPFVPEQDAPGVTAYRKELQGVLAGRKVQSLPHEQIIAKVDETGKLFHILILKTNLTIPYTSVFLQLDCKYWSADAEARLRQAMKQSQK